MNTDNYSLFAPSKCNHCIEEDFSASSMHNFLCKENDCDIHVQDCCTDLNLYINFVVLTTIKDKQKVEPPNLVCLCKIYNDYSVNIRLKNKVNICYNNMFNPPPKSGVEMVIANNCIKIPEFKS